MNLILASASPRRQALLQTLGVPFTSRPADIDEQPRPEESAERYVTRMSREKAAAVFATLPSQPDTWVLGSDTSVVIDGDVLGKPVGFDHAAAMLTRLSGRTHQVLTAVALQGPCCTDVELVTTEVEFTALTQRDINLYWRSGEPADKAGAYGIQGLGGRFVRRIDGDYYAVMGLPLERTAAMLVTAGFNLWQQLLHDLPNQGQSQSSKEGSA